LKPSSRGHKLESKCMERTRNNRRHRVEVVGLLRPLHQSRPYRIQSGQTESWASRLIVQHLFRPIGSLSHLSLSSLFKPNSKLTFNDTSRLLYTHQVHCEYIQIKLYRSTCEYRAIPDHLGGSRDGLTQININTI